MYLTNFELCAYRNSQNKHKFLKNPIPTKSVILRKMTTSIPVNPKLVPNPATPYTRSCQHLVLRAWGWAKPSPTRVHTKKKE